MFRRPWHSIRGRLPSRLGLSLWALCVLIAPLASAQVNLTQHRAYDREPAWSPDGSMIAFASIRDGNYDIYVMNVDGSTPVNLTDSGGGRQPRWSPDGSKIAFTSSRDGNSEVYVMDADGSNPVNLTQRGADDYSPSWSPDGSKIVFRRNRDLFVMRADGSEPVNITRHNHTLSGGGSQPRWSPDGSKIAFTAGGIHVMDADGSNRISLTQNWRDLRPSWSPDGARIIFESKRDGNSNIYVTSADGADIARVTTGWNWFPDWSPDGSKIVFTSRRDGNRDIFVGDIGVAKLTEVDTSFWRDVITGNDDDALNPGESIETRLRLTSLALAAAQNVVVSLTTSSGTVVQGDVVSLGDWPVGEDRTIDGIVTVDPDAVDMVFTVTATVTADNGGPWAFTYTKPVVLSFDALLAEVKAPFWTRDKDTGNNDGDINPSENVETRVRLRNSGLHTARNVVVFLKASSGEVVEGGTVFHGDWPVGEARTINGLVAVDQNAVDMVFTVTATAENGGPWVFTYAEPVTLPLDALLAEANTPFWTRDKSTGNGDGALSPGEYIETRVRLTNVGLVTAENVVVSLGVSSGTVVQGATVIEFDWPVGEARTVNGLVTVSQDAAAMLFTVTVSADNGGPWAFAYQRDVIAVDASLAEAGTPFWIRDKVTGNDDGNINPGENIETRVRLKNIGLVAVENAVVSLTASSGTIVEGATVSQGDWPIGEARTISGLVNVDQAATGMVFTVTVTADNGGPWAFAYTQAVAPADAFLAEATTPFWTRDKTTGNNDGYLNPGEDIETRVRLKHGGLVAAENVVVSLAVSSGTVVQGATVSQGDWPAGEARTTNGLVTVDQDATEVGFTVTVTADNRSAMTFTYTRPVAPFVFRNAWARDKTTGDADGLVERGERVEVRVRLRNQRQTAEENVVVVLTPSDVDADVTIAAGTVSHASWQGGEARNNVGLLVDLGTGLGSTVSFIATVTTDNGGPWEFPFEIPVAVPAAPAAVAVAEDVDRDGFVDIRDILAVAVVYGRSVSALPSGDLNDDGILDMADMVAIERARSDVFYAAPSVGQGPPSLVRQWLGEARRSNDGSRVYRDGIASLESILRSLMPEATALLPNYPNPFNPETWIPFELSEASEVALTIYDALGRSIKRLDLGYQEPGVYRARSQAAYWDGRNEAGEVASSGVYFVELRAGRSRELRRLVLRK